MPDGCTDPLYLEYDATAQCDDGSCATLIVNGCTDATACNYNATANVDDGSCILPDGCTDPTAFNYDPAATCDDGSCTFSSASPFLGLVLEEIDNSSASSVFINGEKTYRLYAELTGAVSYTHLTLPTKRIV